MEERREVRVVALLGAAVEALCAMELQQLLVGRSHECTYPPQIQSLPCVSFLSPQDHSPWGLHSKEQGFIQKALAPFDINLKLLRELKPDVIITQDRCEASGGGGLDDLQKACGRFIFGDDKKCRLLSLNPKTIEDIFQNIQSIANVCKSSNKGKDLVSSLKTRWKQARQRTPQWVDGVPSINVACLQWLKPLIGAGHWIPEIIECAGGFNIFGESGHNSPVISWPEFMHMDPDVIVIACFGLNIAKASSALASLQKSNDWRQLRAVVAKRVYIVNGERYFNLPGPAAVESAELMVEILQGADTELAFVYRGTSYVQWEGKNSVECEVLEDKGAGRQGIEENCLMEKDIRSEQEIFLSHLRLDSLTSASYEHRGKPFTHSRKGDMKDCSMSKGFQGKKQNAVKDHRKIDRLSSCTCSGRRNSVVDISPKDSIPSALNEIRKICRQYSGYSLHSFLSGSDLPFMHEDSFADAVYRNRTKESSMEVLEYNAIPSIKLDSSPAYAKPASTCGDDQLPNKFFESIPAKESPPSASRPSDARNSCKSVLDSTSLGRTSGTEFEKEVLSMMWTSTKAAAKCRSPRAANISVDSKKVSHGRSKDPETGIMTNSPASELVIDTDIHPDQNFEGLQNKTATFACTNCNVEDSQGDSPLREKQSEGLWRDANVISKDSDLGVHNSKSSSFHQKASTLRSLIVKTVKELPCADCLLLSGGTGSTILAEAAKRAFPKSYKKGLTVLTGPSAKDKYFSELVSKEYGMKHIIVGGGDKGSPTDLLEKQLDFVIETLRTYNTLEVQRALALATALCEAKRLGFSSVVTGDGADELFSGHYSMHSMTEEEFYHHRYEILSSMTHASVFLGKTLGIKVLQPYLNPKVVEFAAGLSKAELIGPMDGKVHDKFFLRHAFSKVVTAQRSKDPIEVGSGTYALSEYFARQVSWAQFKSEACRIFCEDRVHIKDPEQLAYYLVFQRIFKNPIPPEMVCQCSDPCVDSGYQVDQAKRRHCLTCGHQSDKTRISRKNSLNLQSRKKPHNQHKQPNSVVDDLVYTPVSKLEHFFVKTMQESPVNKFCNAASPDLKSMVRSISFSDADNDTADDGVNDIDSCKGPVPELLHNFEQSSAESEVRYQKWFWKLAAGITALVFVLRPQLNSVGS